MRRKFYEVKIDLSGMENGILPAFKAFPAINTGDLGIVRVVLATVNLQVLIQLGKEIEGFQQSGTGSKCSCTKA